MQRGEGLHQHAFLFEQLTDQHLTIVADEALQPAPQPHVVVAFDIGVSGQQVEVTLGQRLQLLHVLAARLVVRLQYFAQRRTQAFDVVLEIVEAIGQRFEQAVHRHLAIIEKHEQSPPPVTQIVRGETVFCYPWAIKNSRAG